MRKTVVLLLSAAFLAALPSIASAKQKRVRHAPPPAQTQSMGGKFVAAALYQLVVPWEQTFSSRPVVEKKVRVRHAHKRRAKTS